MSRWQSCLLHTANLLVGGTGLVYGLMRYFMRPADEWAVVNHPWQPHVQHLHLLFAPLLVFACGWIWQGHVAGHLRQGEEQRRRSGPGLVVTLTPMIASGYLIQTTVSEGWRQAWIVLHLVSSAAWLLAFLGHWLSPRVRSARRRVRSFHQPFDGARLDTTDGGAQRTTRFDSTQGGPLRSAQGSNSTLVQPSRRSSKSR